MIQVISLAYLKDSNPSSAQRHTKNTHTAEFVFFSDATIKNSNLWFNAGWYFVYAKLSYLAMWRQVKQQLA